MLVLRRLSVSLGLSSKSDTHTSSVYQRSRSADTHPPRRSVSPARAALSESESAAPAAPTSRRRLVKKKRKHRDDDDARGREPRLPDVALDVVEDLHPPPSPRTPAFALQKRVPPPPITDFPTAPSPVSHDSFLALNPTPPTTNPLGFGPLGVIHEQDERSVRSGPGSVSAWSTMLGERASVRTERDMLVRPAAPSPPGSLREEHGLFYMFPSAAAHDTSSAATASPRPSADAPRLAHRSLEIDEAHPAAPVPDAQDEEPVRDAHHDPEDAPLPPPEPEGPYIFPISPPTPPHTTSSPLLPAPPLPEQENALPSPIAPLPTRPLRPHPFLEGLAGERMGGRVSRKPVPGAADVPVDVREDEGESEGESEAARDDNSDMQRHAPEQHTHQDEESGDVRPLDHHSSDIQDENTAYLEHELSREVERRASWDEDADGREEGMGWDQDRDRSDGAESLRDEGEGHELVQEPYVSRNHSDTESWGEVMMQDRDMARRYSGEEDRHSWIAERSARGPEMGQEQTSHDHPAAPGPGNRSSASYSPDPPRPAWAPQPVMPRPLAPQTFAPQPSTPLHPPGLPLQPHPYAHARAPPSPRALSPASVPLPLSPTFSPVRGASPPLPPLPVASPPAMEIAPADTPFAPSSYNPPSRTASLTRAASLTHAASVSGAESPARTASLTRRNVLRKRAPPAAEPRFSMVSPVAGYNVEPWRRERPQSYHGHSAAPPPEAPAPHAQSHEDVAEGAGAGAEEPRPQKRVARKLSKRRRP